MTTWPAFLAEDAISGDGAAETLPLALWDRNQVLKQSGATVKQTGSTGSGSFVPLDSFPFRVPEFLRANEWMRLHVHAVPTGGAGELRLHNATNGVSGPAVAVASAGFYLVELQIESAWIGNRRTIETQGRVTTASSIAVDCVGLLMGLRYRD